MAGRDAPPCLGGSRGGAGRGRRLAGPRRRGGALRDGPGLVPRRPRRPSSAAVAAARRLERRCPDGRPGRSRRRRPAVRSCRTCPRSSASSGRSRARAPLPGHPAARRTTSPPSGSTPSRWRSTRPRQSWRPGRCRHNSNTASSASASWDNAFDQGTAALAPLIGPTLAGDDVAAASHVPDWAAAGLAPQPPLASVWPTTGRGRRAPSRRRRGRPKSTWTGRRRRRA